MAKENFVEVIQNRFKKSVKEVLLELANNNYTQKMAACYLQCSETTISVYARKYNISFVNVHQKDRSKTKLPIKVDQLQIQISHVLSKNWV